MSCSAPPVQEHAQPQEERAESREERPESRQEDPLIPDCVPSTSGEERGGRKGNTQLSRAGLDEAQTSCEVTFDLTEGRLLKTDVGLQPEDNVPWISAGELFTLKLIGSKGTLEARTDKVLPYEGDNPTEIDQITYFLTSEDAEEFFEIIRRGADAYGFDQAAVERGIEEMKADPGEEHEFVVGEGYALGFFVSYEVTYRPPGHVSVITAVVAPDKANEAAWELD